ncbi:MAG: very short patch repair endonuclease [Mucispirillum sp.]|nr:very short patch repair endonuclease [Mucispirillum sp.]
MSKISGKNTKPEILVRKYLFANGFRFRVNDKRLPGKPDILLPKYKAVVFINGCFWHCHENCKYAALPVTNTVFWKNKIISNTERDKAIQFQLKQMGYRVFIIWQCQLKAKIKENTLLNLINELKNQSFI